MGRGHIAGSCQQAGFSKSLLPLHRIFPLPGICFLRMSPMCHVQHRGTHKDSFQAIFISQEFPHSQQLGFCVFLLATSPCLSQRSLLYGVYWFSRISFLQHALEILSSSASGKRSITSRWINKWMGEWISGEMKEFFFFFFPIALSSNMSPKCW